MNTLVLNSFKMGNNNCCGIRLGKNFKEDLVKLKFSDPTKDEVRSKDRKSIEKRVKMNTEDDDLNSECGERLEYRIDLELEIKKWKEENQDENNSVGVYEDPSVDQDEFRSFSEHNFCFDSKPIHISEISKSIDSKEVRLNVHKQFLINLPSDSTTSEAEHDQEVHDKYCNKDIIACKVIKTLDSYWEEFKCVRPSVVNLEYFEDMPEIDEKYLNIYEKGIRFNKDYVISFFEEMEALPQDNWELRVDESFTKCWTSAIGSKFSKSITCIHVQGWFDAKYPYELVVKSIGDINQRLQWDRNIASSHYVESIARNAYCERDFVEKKIVLRMKDSKGCIETMIFSSSVPDSLYPVRDEAVRAFNLFCCLKITKCKDGRTLYRSYAQADPNFYFNIFPIFKRFCGSKAREWYESVTGHMEGFATN